MKRPRRNKDWIEFCLLQDQTLVANLQARLRNPYEDKLRKIDINRALVKIEHKLHRHHQWLVAHEARWKRNPVPLFKVYESRASALPQSSP